MVSKERNREVIDLIQYWLTHRYSSLAHAGLIITNDEPAGRTDGPDRVPAKLPAIVVKTEIIDIEYRLLDHKNVGISLIDQANNRNNRVASIDINNDDFYDLIDKATTYRMIRFGFPFKANEIPPLPNDRGSLENFLKTAYPELTNTSEFSHWVFEGGIDLRISISDREYPELLSYNIPTHPNLVLGKELERRTTLAELLDLVGGRKVKLTSAPLEDLRELYLIWQ